MNATIRASMLGGECGDFPRRSSIIGAFQCSVYEALPSQKHWSEAFCCPRCGRIWGRLDFLPETFCSIEWVFTSRPCGQNLLSDSSLDYLLAKGPDLSHLEMEFLVHEYLRARNFYASDLSERRAASGRIPDVSEL